MFCLRFSSEESNRLSLHSWYFHIYFDPPFYDELFLYTYFPHLCFDIFRYIFIYINMSFIVIIKSCIPTDYSSLSLKYVYDRACFHICYKHTQKHANMFILVRILLWADNVPKLIYSNILIVSSFSKILHSHIVPRRC